MNLSLAAILAALAPILKVVIELLMENAGKPDVGKRAAESPELAERIRERWGSL